MEKIAEAIDTLENLIAALAMAIPDGIHVNSLRESLPELRDKIKAGYLESGGEDHWA